MPQMRLPKNNAECELWKEVVTSDYKKVFAGITPKFKHTLKHRFFVMDGQLYDHKRLKPVFILDQFADKMTEFHNKNGHPGRDAVVRRFKQDYADIPYSIVADWIKNCPQCRLRVPPYQPVAAADVPVVSKESRVWNRLGIDMIDMTTRPDGEFNWIFHAKDCASKFTYARAMRTNASGELAETLKDMFHVLGPPNHLHYDHGKPFMGREVVDMMDTYFPTTQIIATKPLDPLTPIGLIEGSNQVILDRINAWNKQTEGKIGWASVIRELIYYRNSDWCSSLGAAPFTLFFDGRHSSSGAIATPRRASAPGDSSGISAPGRQSLASSAFNPIVSTIQGAASTSAAAAAATGGLSVLRSSLLSVNSPFYAPSPNAAAGMTGIISTGPSSSHQVQGASSTSGQGTIIFGSAACLPAGTTFSSTGGSVLQPGSPLLPGTIFSSTGGSVLQPPVPMPIPGQQPFGAAANILSFGIPSMTSAIAKPLPSAACSSSDNVYVNFDDDIVDDITLAELEQLPVQSGGSSDNLLNSGSAAHIVEAGPPPIQPGSSGDRLGVATVNRDVNQQQFVPKH